MRLTFHGVKLFVQEPDSEGEGGLPMPDEGLRTVLDVCSRMDWTGYEDSESKEVVSMMMMISGDKYFSFVRYGQKCRKCKQFYSRPLPFYFSESHIKWDGSHPWRSCNPIIRNVLRIQQLMMEPSQTDFSLVEPIYIFMFVTLNLNLGSRAGLDSSLNSILVHSFFHQTKWF